MSEETLCVVITALVIALMFAWVPVLEFVCPRCSRVLERLRQGNAPTTETRQGMKAMRRITRG